MEDNRSDNGKVGRRLVLQLLGASGLVAGSSVALLNCSKSGGGGGASGEGKAVTTNPLTGCADVPFEDKQNMRKLLQYNYPAVDPNKHCSICAQFQQGQYGACGGCKLFPGPVNPGGGCLSFAPQGTVPAASASSHS